MFDELARSLRLQSAHLILIALIGLLILVGSLVSDRFFTTLNFSNVQDQMVALALIALAQTFVILSGGIDLSYSGMLGLLCVIFAALAGESSGSLIVALAVVLALGAALGAINGVITAYSAIHPLVVTLATATILGGAALLHSKQPGGSVPLFFEELAYERIQGVPYGTLLALGLYCASALILARTRFGTRLYAIGDNERAAALSGVPVRRTKVVVYTLSGFLAGVTAIYLTARFGVGDPRAGVGFDLRSITPVIVGGTLLAGGYGGVVGTFLAVILLSLLANMLNFMNVSGFYQWIVEGVIIIVAVSVFVSRKPR
ncbi:MAG: ABC transporter permease [Ectothiorhodospiraceae bacterium AqS1]|nr:ABC transporter permease [Ectothiorhodospiraceae bacterium AqS1]